MPAARKRVSHSSASWVGRGASATAAGPTVATFGTPAALALALLALAACGPRAPASKATGHDSPVVASNILRADYAGSDACAGCHADIFAAWRDSPMRLMTRRSEGANIRAPFDGATFTFKSDRARFETAGGARYVTLQSERFGHHIFRVTRVIGGRYREDYAGVEVSAPRADATVLGRREDERILPVSFVYETGTFRLKGYSVMVRERPGLRIAGVWNQTCVFCHNTVPLFDSLWGTVLEAATHSRAPGYQGQVVDRLLPVDRRVSYRVRDQDALLRQIAREVEHVHPPKLGAMARSGDQPQQEGWVAHEDRDRRGERDDDGDDNNLEGAAASSLLAGIRALRHGLDGDDLIEVGIGCESCHGGSREHARAPRISPAYEPRSPFLVAEASGRHVTRAEWINRACARCHQVLFSRYPFTWEGGDRDPRRDHGDDRAGRPPGGSHITSGEARDFLLGGCARVMACTTCHDPHAEDSREVLAALATPAGNRVCTPCHQALAAPDALARHAHHDPTRAGGSCIACHMPRKNMGLGYALTRYHRIGRPNERVRVEADRPLECALCHADKSVAELVSTMERWWGKSFDRAALTRLYGDLAVNTLTATLERGKPHEQATAIAVLGDARAVRAAGHVAGALAHSYPLVRHYARRALETILGRPCPSLDLDADPDRILAQTRNCLLNDRRGDAASLKGLQTVTPRSRHDASAAASDDED